MKPRIYSRKSKAMAAAARWKEAWGKDEFGPKAEIRRRLEALVDPLRTAPASDVDLDDVPLDQELLPGWDDQWVVFRRERLRELYPRLPSAPLPAVITCIATTAEARGRGHAMRLVDAVCDALGKRGFSAIEVYPDLTEPADGTSAATPRFWEACGFTLVIPDERYPVLRRELA